MRNISIAFAATTLLTSAMSSPAHAQDAKFNELKRATDNISAVINAENNKSALCKSYVGKVASLTGFETLARTVPKITEKSEFETTAQYQARIAAAKALTPGGPYILMLGADRDHIHYDADLQGMIVEAGAFRTGQYSDEPLADLAAWGVTDAAPSGGTPMFHSRGVAKLAKTYSAMSRSGVPFQVSEFERHTNSLYVTSSQLFGFAKDKGSWVMAFDVSQARAPQLKEALKLALVVTPQSPYLYKHSMGPIVPSLSNRSVYKEFVTVAIVKANCALALDGQNRVVTSMDAGS